jgi:flavin-binding protein dodecin
MSIAKVTEITSTSTKSFDDAVSDGIERANKSLKNVTSAWVADQKVTVEDGKITGYQVRMKITFILQ